MSYNVTVPPHSRSPSPDKTLQATRATRATPGPAATRGPPSTRLAVTAPRGGGRGRTDPLLPSPALAASSLEPRRLPGWCIGCVWCVCVRVCVRVRMCVCHHHCVCSTCLVCACVTISTCTVFALIIYSKKLNIFAAYYKLFKLWWWKIASPLDPRNRKKRNSTQLSRNEHELAQLVVSVTSTQKWPSALHNVIVTSRETWPLEFLTTMSQIKYRWLSSLLLECVHASTL